MRLNRSTSHAIRILIECARADNRLVKVAEVSRRLRITPQNTFKSVNLLARAGFLSAVRGRHGGVRLSRPAAEIRIGNVVRVMEATAIEIEEDEAASPSGPASAGINRILDNALEAFISVLDQHTLAEMARTARAGGVQKPARRAPRAGTKAAAKTAGSKRQAPI
jgi:Rrf2 family nitric oxide-sensitive transcriptional repressor